MKRHKIVVVILVAILILFAAGIFFNSNTQRVAFALSDEQTVTNGAEEIKDKERNNFDSASFLSLLSIGLLKFIDEKLRIKLKNKIVTYKNCLAGATCVFSILELFILIGYVFDTGPSSFGNLKNCFLGLIPVVFCALTLFTVKSDQDSVVLSRKELEKHINDFTASGSSPLCIIVGDMDFLGNVYKRANGRRKHKDDITNSTQIKTLVDKKIDPIEIVCKVPKTDEAKRRIGYLLQEFEGQFQIRFFDESKYSIPKMRGRVMCKQNEQFVVITRKIRKPTEYEYGEYAPGSLVGGLFVDLWNVVWGCSENDSKCLDGCKQAYNTYVGKQKAKP